MNPDDDTPFVCPAVFDLGALISDISLLVILTAVQVNGIRTHRHEGDEEGITRQVPAGVVALLIGNGSNVPNLLDGQRPVPSCREVGLVNLPVIHIAPDEQRRRVVVVVHLPNVVEYATDVPWILVRCTGTVTQ